MTVDVEHQLPVEFLKKVPVEFFFYKMKEKKKVVQDALSKCFPVKFESDFRRCSMNCSVFMLQTCLN